MIRINYKIVLKVVGLLIFILGLFLMLPCLLTFFFEDVTIKPFLLSSGISLAVGSALFIMKVPMKEIKKREGYLIVALGWLFLCLFGALPYIMCPSTSTNIVVSDAIFESTSGFTTTGATIFNDIESLHPTFLLWRSMTQWIGGMGIIVFTIAIFPILGIGGVELFVAESPGPTANKIHPRIKEVAKRLWLIYVGLTSILMLILHYFSKMNWFDAINHAMTTMSTGGFSTKNDSIAYFDSSLVEYPIILFMLIGGINYTVLYYFFKGKLRRAWSSEELKFYLSILLVVITVISAILISNNIYDLETSFRTAAFTVISLVTTTGYVTADYTSWTPTTEIICFLLLFFGACAGSTSGGVKMIRHLVFFKTTLLEFKRILHPREFIRMKIDGEVVTSRILMHILVFLLFYLILFGLGVFVMSFFLIDDPTPFKSSLGAIATALGNVGPSIGSLGPVDNFSSLSSGAKLFLSVFMVIGRLEIFTIIIILTPYFWRIK